MKNAEKVTLWPHNKHIIIYVIENLTLLFWGLSACVMSASSSEKSPAAINMMASVIFTAWTSLENI